MVDVDVAVRRLRNLISDKPYGYSESASGFSTDITTLTNPSLQLAFGEGNFFTIVVDSSGLDSGFKIAQALQAQIRAASIGDLNFSLAKVSFTAAEGYTLVSGSFGTQSSITVIPPASGDDLSDALKLGAQFGGVEVYKPQPRYDNGQIEEALRFAVVQWNQSAPKHLQICSLEDAEEPILTIILYYAWIMLLEQDAGNTVYSFRQKLGGDELALTDIHKNILDLLKYLKDRIDELEEDLGVDTITVGTLTRYDREHDMRFPLYVQTMIGPPIFKQLVAETPTSILVEWGEVRVQDFANATVWLLDNPALSPMVDKALLNVPDSGRPNAVISQAVNVRQTASPINTVVRISNLNTQVYHIVVVFQDTRGNYYWSNEYSVDLTQVGTDGVLVARNHETSIPGANNNQIC